MFITCNFIHTVFSVSKARTNFGKHVPKKKELFPDIRSPHSHSKEPESSFTNNSMSAFDPDTENIHIYIYIYIYK